MNYSLAVLDWHAIAPGLNTSEDWHQWALLPTEPVFTGDIAKSQRIPMMSARRMSPVSRIAVEAALALIEKHQIDRAVFTSRHGELERTYKILQTLAMEQQISPTDFSMSVHNTAAGWMTIEAKNTLPVTSLSAGSDSFQQGLLEARAMLSVKEVNTVLLVDFDGCAPDMYAQNQNNLFTPYCVAIILTKGESLNCRLIQEAKSHSMPQSLQFLRHYLLKDNDFPLAAGDHYWQWHCEYN